MANDIRAHNPFQDLLVTELIENPLHYRRLFSPAVLVSETMAVFRATNAVLVGPQGSGKSMILNLIKWPVMSQWLAAEAKPPDPLRDLAPWFGISVNLVRNSLQVFGRRSLTKSSGTGEDIDAICAGDYLNHLLFREFLRGLEATFSAEASGFRDWLGLPRSIPNMDSLAKEMSSWRCWFGYYRGCDTLERLRHRCEYRLDAWLSFLNASADIPKTVWKTKTSIGEPMHSMGNLLTALVKPGRELPLFVLIDQYEELKNLNLPYGESLQRAVNTAIKGRDPTVFYKLGSRSYGWGKELRVIGSESRIEEFRDYIKVDLADALTRGEDPSGWVFPRFAEDVAAKRIWEGDGVTSGRKRPKTIMRLMLGKHNDHAEADEYFPRGGQSPKLLTNVPVELAPTIVKAVGPSASALDLRLAGAWAIQQVQRGRHYAEIAEDASAKPWNATWWRKERIETALLQLASLANQKRYYFGWETIKYLAGGNITAFLLICSEIWDEAAKVGIDPTAARPIAPQHQTRGINKACDKWRQRDRNERARGRRRYEVVNRLGTGIARQVLRDLAISNPGHTGFSLSETELASSEGGLKVEEFLDDAVNWAIMEQRPHTSKSGEGRTRRKFYLHPLLSPAFGIPHKRVKEPLYVDVATAFNWIFGDASVQFGPNSKPKKGAKKRGKENPAQMRIEGQT
jgi:hypothetical protein